MPATFEAPSASKRRCPHFLESSGHLSLMHGPIGRDHLAHESLHHGRRSPGSSQAADMLLFTPVILLHVFRGGWIVALTIQVRGRFLQAYAFWRPPAPRDVTRLTAFASSEAIAVFKLVIWRKASPAITDRTLSAPRRSPATASFTSHGTGPVGREWVAGSVVTKGLINRRP